MDKHISDLQLAQKLREVYDREFIDRCSIEQESAAVIFAAIMRLGGTEASDPSPDDIEWARSIINGTAE